MKSENWIIVELLAALMVITLLSFFLEPRYEKGAWFGIGVFAASLSLILGYKFGKNMPQQARDVREGQTSVSGTSTKITSDAQKP